MPHALIITYYFPPWGMGGVQRVTKWVKYLPQYGWDVTVIAPEPGSYPHHDPSLLDETKASARIERIAYRDPASGFVASGTSAPGSLRRLGRWLDWPDRHRGYARKAAARARQLLTTTAFDVVITSSPPPSIHLAGMALSREVAWVADFRDPWQARRNDFGPSPVHRRYNQNLRRKILDTADAVIAVTPALRDDLKLTSPLAEVHCIPNGFDEADFAPMMPPQLREDVFTIICPGTFSEFSPPNPVFRLLAEWRKKSTRPFRLVHVGTAIGIDPMRAAQAYGLADIFQDTGYLPHRDAVGWLMRADVIVFAYGFTSGLECSVPGRVYECLRSLKPIISIVAGPGALWRLMQDYPGCTPIVELPEGLRALEESVSQPRGAPARALDAIRVFDRKTQAGQLATLCLDIIGRRQGRGA